MDYSASVLLPWHAASIPRVPEWLAPFRGRPRTDGWVDWRVGGLMYGSRNTLRRPFTSSRSAINSDRVAWRSARCTDLQGRGDALCNLRLRRWGAPSQKVYAMTVNHIPCLPPPPRERASWLFARDRASGPVAAMRTQTSFWLGEHEPHSRSQPNLRLNYVTVISCDGKFAEQL